VSVIDERAARTEKVLAELAARVKTELGGSSERILRNDTCVYVVGSGGRGEMSDHSDVDLFVARVKREPSDVDALLVRGAIAQALYALELPDPSQGGEYLRMHTAGSLCARIGTPEDDASNTLTARMLLLLESRPLVGPEAYEQLLDKVVEAYWRDAKDHADDFHPFMLVNDIVRYWRILLLNYAAKIVEKERELSGDHRDADRRVRSYKLRFSRCLTCFSALARLLAVTGQGAVDKKHLLAIVQERPIDRLRTVGAQVSDAKGIVEELLRLYESFLSHTDAAKDALVERFRDAEYKGERMSEGQGFGDKMFQLLQALARDDRSKTLLRHMLV
jgi:hypothetical protein